MNARQGCRMELVDLPVKLGTYVHEREGLKRVGRLRIERAVGKSKPLTTWEPVGTGRTGGRPKVRAERGVDRMRSQFSPCPE